MAQVQLNGTALEKHAANLLIVVRPERFELPASWFVARRSIQLSYGRALTIIDGKPWRRGRDSNPRWAFDPYALSRGAPSTTRPPLRMGLTPAHRARDHTRPGVRR